MSLFVYQALTETGKKESGQLEAPSMGVAQDTLARQGLMPIDIKETRSGSKPNSSNPLRSLVPWGKVKALDIILFTRQFEVMVRAGVPIIQLFKILEEQTESPRLKKVVGALWRDIENGSDIEAAVKKHNGVFDKLYSSMIAAGETSGSLDEILKRLTYIIEHEDKVKHDIKAAMRYPTMVVCLLVAVFFFMLNFIIPKFQAVFDKAKIELPMPTRICIALSDFFNENWLSVLGGVILTVVSLVMYVRTKRGRYVKDYLTLKLPLIGPVITKSIMSRFSSVFSILISSGISVLNSLDILRETLGNTVVTSEFEEVSEKLRHGDGISSSLKKAKSFPPLLCNIVAVGEESGQLDDLLRDISRHYDVEVDIAIKKMVDAIPTVLTIGLAVVVGFFAMAIYLPIWKMTQMAINQ